MRKPVDERAREAIERISRLTDEQREKLIHDVLEGSDGAQLSKIIAGLYLIGYTGHAFEASIPGTSIKQTIEIRVRTVEDGE